MTDSAAAILVVDDDIQNRKLLELLLRSQGYATSHAASGEEALAMVAQRAPDLILLDVMMPGMDGYAVARSLKGCPATANIPIIMVTAQIDGSARLAGLDAGAEDFLTKPFDRAELWLRVRNLLRMKALSDRLQNHGAILEAEVRARTATLQRFRTAMDATADAIVLIDRGTMSFVEVNATACNMFGYTRAEMLEAGPSLLAEAGAGHLEREYDAVIAGRGPAEMQEIQLQRKDGSALQVEIRRHAERSGDAWIIVDVVRDISERKRNQDALRTLNAELEDRVRARTAELSTARNEAEQASRAKSAFLAAMSHEIRTPLNGVVGMIDVLQHTTLAGDQIEMVDVIRDSAFSLLAIIDDILDLSKIEAGKASLQQEPVRLAHVVEQVCAMLDQTALARGCRISSFVDPRIPRTIVGDGTRLRQVLVNLAGNAIKFSRSSDGIGKVSVRAELVERQDQVTVVDLVVADNGIGMDESALAKLFKPFSQADLSTTRRYGGTGLGLAICAQLVGLMDGTISVRSVPGLGSTFSARIRFSVVEEPGSEACSGVEGLPCRIVGVETPLADDLAAYLVHAGAQVERSPDLADAGAADRPEGLCLWLILPGSPSPTFDELRATAPHGTELQTRFVVLGRGTRHRPRVEAADVVGIDIDPLFPRTLFEALALAAGRTMPEQPGIGAAKPAFTVAPIPHRDEARRQGRLILVAEDNATNRDVIARQLRLIGFAADVVVNGRDALESWRTGDFALLLTDLHMPEMDGYGLAAAIRAEEGGRSRIPIIALTANALRDEADRCRAAGMDAYLTKPLRLEQLKAALETWLGPPSGGPATAEPLPAIAALGAIALPAVNLDVLIAMIGDDPKAIGAVLQTFRESAAQTSGELRHAIDGGIAQGAAEAAHKLKSAARSIGAMRLGAICAEVESVAERGISSQLVASLSRFQVEMDCVNRFLNAR